jgi:hypothetical protein
VLALAHLVLPALTSLNVDAHFVGRQSNDIGLLMPHDARNVHGLQDIAPLQSILISGVEDYVKILAWTIPDADIDCSPQTTKRHAPRMAFHAWH